MRLEDLPFHIGGTTRSFNPYGLPNTWPFILQINTEWYAINQHLTPELLGILDKAYRVGQMIGTPLSEDTFGKPYADDFLNFIKGLNLPRSASAIEIGAGVGYLTHRLQESGLRVIGIEPGHGYSAYWEKNEVEIVNDFFPTSRVTGSFDLICSYAVLEHITEPMKFLKEVRNQMAPNGIAVFSVPDCTDEIISGDPSILLHEHISYFDAGSLKRLIQSVGMNAVVKKSGYGRCLYAVASLNEHYIEESQRGLDLEIIESYPDRCIDYIERVKAKLSGMAVHGTLGIYCAARGLALLEPKWNMRFFDDDPEQQDKFLPPFDAVIEGRENLLLTPVDYVVILSRTFGQRIKKSLRSSGYLGNILTVDDLL